MTMNDREKAPICLVFAMGMEAAPFLKRVQVRRKWTQDGATFREVFFEGRTLLVVRCGIGPERASLSLRNLDKRPSVVLSVGSAGALVPALRFGDLVVAGETVFKGRPDGLLTCSEELTRALFDACAAEEARCVLTRVVTVTNAVFSREAREELHMLTNAGAVDMESHAVAEEAARLGVPFTAFRVISDDLYSPALPDLAAFKKGWRNPLRWKDQARGLYRWSVFLRDFRNSVEKLPPILVRLIRATGR